MQMATNKKTLRQATLLSAICSSVVGAYLKIALPSNYHENTNSIWHHLQLQTNISGLKLSKMQILIPA